MPNLLPAVIQRMKELWEVHRLRGARLNERVEQEFARGELPWTRGLPDGTTLPIHRTTPYNMARRLKWDSGDGDDEGPISGIDDPIWHLSYILAEKQAHQYTHSDPATRRLDVEQIVFMILMDVDGAYRPKPKMFRKLEPQLITLVAEEKRKYQSLIKMTEEVSNSESQEISAEALARGFGFSVERVVKDDGHAGLDIVYTNPEEPEKEDEIPEKFWPLLEAQGWQPPTKEVEDGE